MKLDRFEAVVIYVSVWAAWFLAAWMYTHDWPRALGSSIVAPIIGLAAVNAINARRKKKTASATSSVS